MDISSEISILRQQKKDAIENCNFKNARLLDQRIIFLKEKEKMNLESIAQVQSQINYETAFLAAETDYIATREIFLGKIVKKKLFYQQNEELLDKKKSQKLTLLSEQYAKDVELATGRPIIESEVLISKAKINAHFSNFDKAEELFDLSESIREESMKKRLFDLLQKYEDDQKKVLIQYEADLLANQENLESALDLIDAGYKEECSRIKKRLAIAAIRNNIIHPKKLQFSPIRDQEQFSHANSARSLSSSSNSLISHTSLSSPSFRSHKSLQNLRNSYSASSSKIISSLHPNSLSLNHSVELSHNLK